MANLPETGLTEHLQVPDDLSPAAMRRNLVTLSRLMQVSAVLNSTLDIDKLLQFIMDSAADITQAESTSILLMDKNTNQLRFAATTSGADIAALQKIEVPLTGSIAGRIFTENKAVIIDNAPSDPQHFSEVGKTVSIETETLVGVPMRIKEDVIGVLEAINKKQGNFDDEDVRYLTILASQAAIAIENARLVEALQQALDDLDRLDKLKSDFIAIASHELRTPLGVILGYATFLKEEAQGEASDHADVVLSSALRMRTLIEDMTNLHYIESIEGDLETELVTINSLMRETQQDVLELSEAKGQALLVNMPVEQVEVKANRERLVQAFTNILNNAVKFTPEGGVIEYSATVREREHEVWITVTDNGIGIQAQFLDRVFDQFFQVEDHMTRRHGGMGLGLSIAQGIIHHHNGRIWAECPGPNMGTTFYVSLPLAGH